MNGPKTYATWISRVWRVLVLAAFFIGLLMSPLQIAHADVQKIGLVTDTWGISDQGLNYMANEGLNQAESSLGIDGTRYITDSIAKYEGKLEYCANQGNVLCFAVGVGMTDAVVAAANAKPGTHFAILDTSPSAPPANLRGILFNEKQAGYLAGALAGKMTGPSVNVVGAVGGPEIPPVVNYLEGFRNGAQCANTGVNVLMNYTGTFTDPDQGADVAEDMISRGADVIFGAAGNTGNSAILYSAQHDVWSIGVDFDQYVSLFGEGGEDGADKLLTSAMKHVDKAVYHTIEDELAENFTSGTVTYGLAEDGVGLAAYHETDSSVPDEVKGYVDDVKDGIALDSIDINYPWSAALPRRNRGERCPGLRLASRLERGPNHR